MGLSVRSSGCHCQQWRIEPDVLLRCLDRLNGRCEPCTKLFDVQQKIASARQVLDELLEEERRLVTRRDEAHDPLISCIPPEIISLIFIRCRLPTTLAMIWRYRYRGYRKELLKSIFISGHVCSSWRRIGQNTPKLWTVLSAAIRPENYQITAGVVHDWLDRARSLPVSLHLSLDYPSPMEIWENRVLQGAFEFVFLSAIAHADRWETLYLTLPAVVLPWLSKALETTALTCLKNVMVNIWGDSTKEASVVCLAASPVRLSIESTTAYLPILVSLERLVKVHVFGISSKDVAKLLTNALALKTSILLGQGAKTRILQLHRSSILL